MNIDNIRYYVIGCDKHKREVFALAFPRLDGISWRVHIQGGGVISGVDRLDTISDTLPEAVDAGKAYLLANGGEVYTDGKEGLVYIKELEGECEAKDKRIEELSSVLAGLFAWAAVVLAWVPARGMDGQPKEFRDAYKALEVKQ